MTLCACDCGQEVNLCKETNKNRNLKKGEPNRYISGHNAKINPPLKNKHHLEETKRKISKSLKGKIRKPLTEEHKRKIGESNKGKHKSEKRQVNQEIRLKISKSLKGKIRKPLTEEHKRKLSLAHLGKPLSEKHKLKLSKLRKILWKDKEFREKVIKNTLKAIFKRPTSYEQKIIILINKYNLSFKYVGDGNLIIGYKNPDFIETNSKKILIEVYNKYFKIRDYGSCENYEQQRSNLFAKYGYKTLFLKDEDLLVNNWEEICLNKIRRFEDE